MDFSFLYSTHSGKLTIVLLLLSLYLVENLWYQTTLMFLAILVIGFLYVHNICTYWERIGIPCISVSFPFGYMKDMIFQRKSFTEILRDLYTEAGDNKYVGVYSFIQPQILVKDMDLLKCILVKDFSNFTDRGVYVNTKVDQLTGNLFSLEGQQWKNLRAKISPTFTSGKLKTMYSNVKEIADNLKNYTVDLHSKIDMIEVKALTDRFSLNVISSIALGLEGNNFKDENTSMKSICDTLMNPTCIQMLRAALTLSSRDLAKFLQIRMTPKEVENYFFSVTRDTVKYRKENHVKRNDFLHLLMSLEEDDQCNETEQHENNTGRIRLTMSEMAAQSFVFVVGGYETTSITLGFLLYELAMNPDAQDRLVEELDSAGPDIKYEELLKLPYLDMVLNETLRKHTPAPLLQRECKNDYRLPGGQTIKAGTLCLISIAGMHRDPKLFPDPERFYPERFSKENKENMNPYSYLPFGGGPRLCIGNRFAYLQLKLAVAVFLSRFMVAPSEKTPLKIKLQKKIFLYNSEGGLWLRLIDRKKY